MPKNLNPMKTIRPDTKHSWPSTQVHWEKRKKIGKIQVLKFSKTVTYLICPHKVFWISSLKALPEKLTSGMPKMLKSHDQPLCAYLMRYDAHIPSHSRSSPKRYIYWKNWNLMKRIQVIIRTPTADGRTDGHLWRIWSQLLWSKLHRRRTVNPVYPPPQLHCGGYDESASFTDTFCGLEGWCEWIHPRCIPWWSFPANFRTNTKFLLSYHINELIWHKLSYPQRAWRYSQMWPICKYPAETILCWIFHIYIQVEVVQTHVKYFSGNSNKETVFSYRTLNTKLHMIVLVHCLPWIRKE